MYYIYFNIRDFHVKTRLFYITLHPLKYLASVLTDTVCQVSWEIIT